jgi:EAL and modified HD-GYP domain-containing signal transduction protein
MSEVFAARQPIFDRWLDVAGYELLSRGGPMSQEVIGSPEGATAAVVLNSCTEIGLERIVGPRAAWINVSREFVLGGLAHSVPPSLVLLEILEDELIDDQLIAAVRGLKREGYRFALDGFQYTPIADRLLRLVDVVKLDLLALGRENLAREVARLKPYGVTLLAEKIETQPDFRYCVEAGCDLFQGYFFCRPDLVRGRGADVNRVSLLEVLAELQDPATQLSDVERMIARDLGLSYRLFRYINSAFFGMRQQVRSIGQALVLLGIENLKQWVTLSIFISVADKPSELIVTALIRARFCELAGDHVQAARRGELFTLGLFSVIDALMDTPMEDVLDKLPFPQDMREALTAHQGDKGRLLESVTALEAGDFDRAETIIPNAGEPYLASLTWANAAAEPLFTQAAPAAA